MFFGPIGKTKWRPWPLIGWDIFDFSSETTEPNSTKLDRKQDLNALYQGCVFRVNRKNKMAALASDWLRHFQLLLWNRWMEFNETWQEASSQCLLPHLYMCFSGKSGKSAHGTAHALRCSARCTQGRIQGRAKIGDRAGGGGGGLLQESASSDWKATATNQMYSNDLEACGMKCCYFLFHSEVNFFMRSLFSGERQWPFGPLVSAPEPKAQVHYCDHALSVVRRPSVRPSSVCPSLTFHIFDFSSETTEHNSM